MAAGDKTILKDTQEADLAPEFQDSKGFKAKVDGVPVWASSDSNVLSVEPSADGLAAVVKAGQPGEDVQITVTADNVVGEGEGQLIGVATFDVVAGDATVVALKVSNIREQ